MAKYFIYDENTREPVATYYSPVEIDPATVAAKFAARPVRVFANKRPGRPWLTPAAVNRRGRA